MKKIFITLIVLSMCSCSYSIKKYSIEDSERMDMLIRHYIYAHFKQPENVNDLIKFIDNMKPDEFYHRQYHFLVWNKRKLLIINNDSATLLFHMRNKKFIIAAENFTTPCVLDEKRSGLRLEKRFFDLDGYCFHSEQLSEQIRMIFKIIQKYEGDVQYKNPYIMILEYTPTKGLIDICTGELFDFKNSEYLSETEQFLANFCKQNLLSRVIFPRYAEESP